MLGFFNEIRQGWYKKTPLNSISQAGWHEKAAFTENAKQNCYKKARLTQYIR